MTAVRTSLDVTAIPDRPAGGGRYVLELASALARRDDVEVTAVTRRGDGARWRALGRTNVVERAPRARPVRLVWEQVALPRVLRDLGVDVHHGPHYTMPQRAPLPKVVTIHDVTFFEHPEWHERSKAPFFRRAIRVAADRAQALVCVSAVTAARLDTLVAPKAAVHVIPHGVDHTRFCPAPGPDDEAMLARLGVRPPFVAFVGTLEPRKDVPTLVRAFDRIAATRSDLSLAIAGLEGWGAAAVSEAIAAAAHGDRVRRLGYLAEAAVPALLRTASVVAYPSLDEGFGLPALEALACGAPLVTTEGTAMAEVAQDAALLVPVGDAAPLAGALEEALDGGAAVEDRRRRGLERAAAYTWEKSAASHAAVYRSVL